MCEYCKKVNNKKLANLDEDNEGVEVFIEYRKKTGGELRAVGSYDGGYGYVGSVIPVNYCPMCGRYLSKEVE